MIRINLAPERSRRKRGVGLGLNISLPAFNLLDLDLSAALAVARDTTWALAHTRHVAAPTLDRPDGTLIATADPGRWSGQPVRVIDVRSR